MHSIRSRIIALTAAAVLLCMLAFAAVTYTTLRTEWDRSAAANMNLLSRNVQQSLDEYLGSIRQSVEMAAHYATDILDPVVLVECGAAGSAAENGPRTPEQAERLDQYLATHSADVQEAFASVANHTSGVVTYYYCIAAEISENGHGFYYSRAGKSGFEEQLPLDARDMDPEDMEHSTWYYTTIRRGRPSWIGPYRALILGERWTVSYVAPIYKASRLIGVLGMDILFTTMQDRVDSVQIYDSGYACLLDADGTVLAHPEWEIGTRREGDALQLQTQVFSKDDSGNDVIIYDADGVEKQLAFATLSNGMKLVITAPTSEVKAVWHRLELRVILIAAAILALLILAVSLIVRRMTLPLQRLSSAAARLSDGDYGAELDYEGKDEIGQLTRTFREMRDHLRLYISDLNSKAYTDGLTRVKNKAAFNILAGRLNQSIRQAPAGEQPEFGIMMFDCNGLKAINDEYGHDRGDVYLRTACGLICRVFSHSPVFRLGGDEFAVLLTQQDYADRVRLAQEFDRAAEEHNAQAENAWEKISAAKGLASFHPDADKTTEEVLKRADKRMYAEKKKSGGSAPPAE